MNEVGSHDKYFLIVIVSAEPSARRQEDCSIADEPDGQVGSFHLAARVKLSVERALRPRSTTTTCANGFRWRRPFQDSPQLAWVLLLLTVTCKWGSLRFGVMDCEYVSLSW